MKKSSPNRLVTLGELERRPELLAELPDDPKMRQVFANVAGALQALHEQVRRWHPGPDVQAGLKFLEILESAKEDPTIKQSSVVVNIVVLYTSLFKNASLRDLSDEEKVFAPIIKASKTKTTRYAVSCRSDQVTKRKFQKVVKDLVESGEQFNQIPDLLDALNNPEFMNITPRFLKSWAIEVGHPPFKAGAPKKKKKK